MTEADIKGARNFIQELTPSEKGLAESFHSICRYLITDPAPSISTMKILRKHFDSMKTLLAFANRYIKGFRKINYPAMPTTVPDEIVSLILEHEFDFKIEEIQNIKQGHLLSMNIENCIGALLERYLDSVLRSSGWHWCIGSTVPAVDFIRQDSDGQWFVLQIKNRDNSENSSSSKVRTGTMIQHWFRSFSRTGNTNWANVPKAMQGKNLTEEGFRAFVLSYLKTHRPQKSES